MVEDERCCGTGTCLINAEGFCWCGQQWDGHTMCRPASAAEQDAQAAQPRPEPADAPADPA